MVRSSVCAGVGGGGTLLTVVYRGSGGLLPVVCALSGGSVLAVRDLVFQGLAAVAGGLRPALLTLLELCIRCRVDRRSLRCVRPLRTQRLHCE
ncbi:MAG: hypothetical protein H7836_16445 [Magnetococcus sp. YQC-3]